MDFQQYGRGIVIFTPTPSNIEQLLALAKDHVEGLTETENVFRVMRHNPETVFVISRGEWQADRDSKNLGFVAQLPLNAEGVDRLFDGRFDTRNPDTAYVCRQHERPAAIYFWGIMINSHTAGGISLVMERLTSEKFRGCPLYCKAANDKAERLFVTLGFRKGAMHRGRTAGDIMICEPSDQEPAQRELFDSYQPGAGPSALGIKVVHDTEELIKVRSIRAATYLAEQDMPYVEDVDGNDLTASHLLGYLGDEPAGTIRIRYFADFVKLERLAVLSRFRRSKLAFSLVRAAIAFCQRKGYRRFYGHAEGDAIKLWQHFGFVVRDGDGMQYLTSRRYFEGDLELPCDSEALSPYSGAEVLLRTEGSWNRPGPLGRVQ